MRFFDVGAQAYGVIAIGQEATGFFALGQIANGYVLAIGQSAFGFIAIGQIARGVFVVGQLAIGVFTLGQLAIGLHTCCAQLGLAGRRGIGAVLPIWPKAKKETSPEQPLVISRDVLEAREVEEGWIDAEVDSRGREVESEGRPITFERQGAHQEAIRAFAGERWRKIWLKLGWVRPDAIKQEGYRDASRGEARLVMMGYLNQPIPAHLRSGYAIKALIRSVILLGLMVGWSYVMAVSFAASFPGKDIPEWLQLF